MEAKKISARDDIVLVDERGQREREASVVGARRRTRFYAPHGELSNSPQLSTANRPSVDHARIPIAIHRTDVLLFADAFCHVFTPTNHPADSVCDSTHTTIVV